MALVKICPSCKTDNPVHLPLCRNCRNNLAGVPRTESRPQVDEDPPEEVDAPEPRAWSENLVCPDPGCGAENPPGNERCLYCNTGLRAGAPAPPAHGAAAVTGAAPRLQWPWGPVCLEGRMPVGRDPNFCPDLSGRLAAYPNVSNCHAELRVIGDRVQITDLGSTNGTFLNERRLTPHQAEIVRHGDRLRFARDLVVQIDCPGG
jgi:ribosomal protein L40E